MLSPVKRYRNLPPFKKGIATSLIALFALAFLIAAIAAFAVMTGSIVVSARPPHNPITTFMLHTTFKNSVASEARWIDKTAAQPFPGQELLGAQHYQQVCSSCHGAPGLGQSPQALSMRPRPQYLPAVVDQFSDAELFVIVRDGVRFSAMPSWPSDSGFSEIWPMVRFLRKLPDMSTDEYRTLVSGPLADAAETPSIAWQERGHHEALKLHAMAPPLKEYAYASPSIGWRPFGFDNRPLSSCVACHGADGTGAVVRGNAPNLTLLPQQMIEQHLRNYANGSRHSGYMAVAATALSEPQIKALAQYFSQKGPKPSNVPIVAKPKSMELGKSLAVNGMVGRGVPACATCHGSSDRRKITGAPDIIGQNEGFLRTRLFGFSEPENPSQGFSSWHPMPYIADNLSESGYGGIAGYFASLPMGSTLTPNVPRGASTNPATMRIEDKPLKRFMSDVCTTCHGDKLAGSAEKDIPNITLQSEPYLIQQLASFRLDHRDSEKMQLVASKLSTDDLVGIARYLSALPPVPSKAANRSLKSSTTVASAAKLAQHGDKSRNLPACLSCHSSKSVKTVALIPTLDGQNAAYLAGRLERWAKSDEIARHKRTLGPMAGIARKLTTEERRGLANYFAQRTMQAKN
ncbi:c-type cytochrome [Parasphingorhabdus sp.]|uniref:c-type cytochrome n=1 Tax=Parasphingorhabdus sp. TaxID=2709688 RepID=UPI003A90C971